MIEQTTASASGVSALTSARRWSIVGLLFLASLINYLDRATISFALPLISKELHLGPSSKGLLLSAFFWSYALMQVPIGWCSDRFDLRWLYAAAFTLWSFAQGLAGWARSLPSLIATRLVLGVGESIYLPGGTKLVGALFPSRDRGLPSGLFDFGTRSGLVVEGVLIPWLLLRYGWRKTFALVGFAALLWVIPWLRAVPPKLTGRGAETASTRSGRSKFTLNRNLLGICLGFFCFDYYWYLLVNWLPDYFVTVRHFTILKAGFYASLPFFVFGVSEPIGGWIADLLIRRGWDETLTRKGMVAGAFLSGLLLIPAVRASDPRAAVALVIGGSLVGLSTGNLIAILQRCAPPDRIGLWTGIENFCGNLAGIGGALATGFLIERTGSYFPSFALAAGVIVTGALAYAFIVGELRPPDSTASDSPS